MKITHYTVYSVFYIFSGQHPFKCQLCKFTAAKKFQLTSHMRTHNKETNFSCDKCPFAGRWRVQLKNHSDAHQSSSRVTCPFCRIVFPHIRSLMHHGRKHKEIEKSVFDSTVQRHAGQLCELQGSSDIQLSGLPINHLVSTNAVPVDATIMRTSSVSTPQ